ncbi:hypothetical protein BDY19DRAFT_893960 [Irpex rosettiformis]|uniref:Uncharacterized protein n=1 Tax=Irpex rosettiformis TaxID=378272 RepID=A0ACB8TXZ3_9APHY|nr:hypothetical protein BDY19DRAFT_893960 [Irpex rosettiformis]
MMQLTEAGLLSTSLEAMLYGFSAFMYIITFWILGRKKRGRRPNYPLLVLTSALLTFTTAELIVNIVHICQGFLGKTPLQAETYFADVTEPTFILKSMLYNCQTLILDGVVIYRAWVVWNGDIRVVVFPMLGWCGLLTSIVGTIVALSTAPKSDSGNVFAKKTNQWITSIYSTTLATNLSATSLLAYRIWRVNQRTTQWRTKDHLSPILRVVIESGALYSLTIIAALITFVIQSPGVYIILDMISPIISIVYNMIIIRIAIVSDGLLDERGDSAHSSGSRSLRSLDRIRRNQNSNVPFRLGWSKNGDGHNVKSLEVEITHYRETDSGVIRDELDAKASGSNLKGPEPGSPEHETTYAIVPHTAA